MRFDSLYSWKQFVSLLHATWGQKLVLVGMQLSPMTVKMSCGVVESEFGHNSAQQNFTL